MQVFLDESRDDGLTEAKDRESGGNILKFVNQQ
jgi:hypothetical protein